MKKTLSTALVIGLTFLFLSQSFAEEVTQEITTVKDAQALLNEVEKSKQTLKKLLKQVKDIDLKKIEKDSQADSMDKSETIIQLINLQENSEDYNKILNSSYGFKGKDATTLIQFKGIDASELKHIK